MAGQTRTPWTPICLLGIAVLFFLSQFLFLLLPISNSVAVATPAVFALVGAVVAVPELREIGKQHTLLVVGLCMMPVAAVVEPTSIQFVVLAAAFAAIFGDLAKTRKSSSPPINRETSWQLFGATLVIAALGMTVGTAVQADIFGSEPASASRLERAENLLLTLATACALSDEGPLPMGKTLEDLRTYGASRQAACIRALGTALTAYAVSAGELPPDAGARVTGSTP